MNARTLAAVAVVMVCAVGCSTAANGDGGPGRPAVETTPTVLDPARLQLPLERYQFDDKEWVRLNRAQNLLAVACMKRYGIEYRPPAERRAAVVRSRTERRYGLADARLARASGYHLPDATRTAPPSPPRLSATQLTVLAGPAPGSAQARDRERLTYRGAAVPDGGCMGEARRTLAGKGQLGDPDVVRRIDSDSVLKASKDPRVRRAFRSWAACMRDKGHDYRDPWQAINDKAFSGTRVSDREKTVARDDVSCKRRTNVVGVWYAVDAAYQKQILKAGGDRVARLAARKHDQLVAADGVIRASAD
ncbi:hypothetical protein [Streptomyces sp. NPDC002952]|uniref:hypothetical protein n=1 Tax=Streptomyces sp. NPDC002952 TaxID=3364673 RepID=UPI003699C159